MPQFSKLPNIHVIIAAAGSGTRFNDKSDIPKQYQDLYGRPIIRHSIDTFRKIDHIKSINCVINKDHLNLYKDAIKDLEPIPYTIGSDTRKQSITNALESLSNTNEQDIVLIHDAARPLITENKILEVIEALKEYPAATLATQVSDTLRKGKENDKCADIVTRDNLWAMQTPQGARYLDLLKAHKTADEQTDDTSLLSSIGITVHIVRGNNSNFKITTKEDFKMAEKILQSQMTTRTGLGFDVHAFDEAETGPLRLGGIDIDFDKKLLGHSDADVALHAITDAILGAIGEGDIGKHFPPSDNSFKDMDSAVFLKKSVELATQKHSAKINNIDLTVICEEPKIVDHEPKMKAQIASLVDISENAINIKGTTTEKLGFTGRKEGIAAQAIVTLQKPA